VGFSTHETLEHSSVELSLIPRAPALMRNGARFVIALTLDLSKDEALGLRWRDVDF
jgi:hypothetical protein